MKTYFDNSKKYNRHYLSTNLSHKSSDKNSLNRYVIPLGITIFCNESQLAKASSPTSSTEYGTITVSRPSHPQNADLPILFTESGITTDFSPLHCQKVASAISVSELGILTEVRPKQSLNAFSPIVINTFLKLKNIT